MEILALLVVQVKISPKWAKYTYCAHIITVINIITPYSEPKVKVKVMRG